MYLQLVMNFDINVERFTGLNFCVLNPKIFHGNTFMVPQLELLIIGIISVTFWCLFIMNYMAMCMLVAAREVLHSVVYL